MSYLGVDPGDLTPDDMYDRTPHEQAVVTEHALAESKVFLEAPVQAKAMGFVTVVSQLREKAKCATCGKTTLVFNLARKGYRPERVTIDTHCTCVGGPAHHLLTSAGSGAESR